MSGGRDSRAASNLVQAGWPGNNRRLSDTEKETQKLSKREIIAGDCIVLVSCKEGDFAGSDSERRRAAEEGRELANNCVFQRLSVFSITTSSQRNLRLTLDCNSSQARYPQMLCFALPSELQRRV